CTACQLRCHSMLDNAPAKCHTVGRQPARPARMTHRTAGGRPVIHFRCPHCRAGLKADNAKVGEWVRCPKCRKPAEVRRWVGERVSLDGGALAEDLEAAPEPPPRRVKVKVLGVGPPEDSSAVEDEESDEVEDPATGLGVAGWVGVGLAAVA